MFCRSAFLLYFAELRVFNAVRPQVKVGISADASVGDAILLTDLENSTYESPPAASASGSTAKTGAKDSKEAPPPEKKHILIFGGSGLAGREFAIHFASAKDSPYVVHFAVSGVEEDRFKPGGSLDWLAKEKRGKRGLFDHMNPENTHNYPHVLAATSYKGNTPAIDQYPDAIDRQRASFKDQLTTIVKKINAPISIVVNAAAKSEPTDCQADPLGSYLINSVFPVTAFDFFTTYAEAWSASVKFVHFSTNYVFNKKIAVPYTFPVAAKHRYMKREDTKASAQTENSHTYPTQKLHAEDELEDYIGPSGAKLAQLYLIRVPCIYGVHPSSDKINSIIKQLKNAEKAPKRVDIRYPLWIKDLTSTVGRNWRNFEGASILTQGLAYNLNGRYPLSKDHWNLAAYPDLHPEFIGDAMKNITRVWPEIKTWPNSYALPLREDGTAIPTEFMQTAGRKLEGQRAELLYMEGMYFFTKTIAMAPHASIYGADFLSAKAFAESQKKASDAGPLLQWPEDKYPDASARKPGPTWFCPWKAVDKVEITEKVWKAVCPS